MYNVGTLVLFKYVLFKDELCHFLCQNSKHFIPT